MEKLIPMKICMVLAGAEEGGMESHVLTLSNELAKRHHVSLIAHCRYFDRVSKKIECHALPMTMSRHNPWLKWQLLQKLKHINPDLAHAQGNKAAALLASIKAFLAFPCIGTLHSQKADVSVFEKLDGVIGVSASVLTNLANPSQCSIYNGVERIVAKPIARKDLLAQWQLPGDRQLCLAIGRLVAVKGFETLINAWRRIHASLVIVGDGPHMNRLQHLIHQRGCQHKIRLAGFRSDVAAILPAADLLVISSDREGFSLVMAEALIAGVPVVSTSVPGPRDILPAQLLCEPGNPRVLAERVEAALAAPERLRELCQPIFARAAKLFSIDAMAVQTESFYLRILGRKEERRVAVK